MQRRAMSPRVPLHISCFVILAAALSTAACGGSTSSAASSGAGEDGGAAGADSAAADDGGAATPESGASEADAEAGVDDGKPTRTSACTPLSQQTGTAINSFHGRLDGYLVYIVPQGGPSSCNGDYSHVHLQVKMNGNIYDVAVDIGKTAGDALFYEADMPPPHGTWQEGWHNDGLSYPQLGVHSTQFTSETPASLAQKIESELANVNHISVFGDAYTTNNGCHDVHYQNGSADGAIVINPLSPTAHILFFRFSTQSF
jgi:hypothetical protein